MDNKTEFAVNDRVVAVKGDFPGLKKGETGTVVGYDYWGLPIIDWDDFNSDRHDCDGMVKSGHGWYIDTTYIRHVSPKDLGELPSLEVIDTKFLFGM